MFRKKSDSIFSFYFFGYVIAQLTEEIKHAFLRLFHLLLLGKYRRVINDIHREGFSIIRGAMSLEDVAAIRMEIKKIIEPLLSDTNQFGLSCLRGSVRFRRPEKHSLLFKALVRDFR